ncbi:MAG: CotH kinase family protein, partial [Lachnospiraceae bacterium]|nr:CotH kinase family protein [Lachnospiraceae bacterium]
MTGKKFDRFAVFIAVFAIIITAVFMNGKAYGLTSDTSINMGYEDKIFDDSYVHTIDIQIDDWDSFIETATEENYTNVDVTIDGENYKNVGLRAKGNTSLSTVAQLGSERYSLKIEFDEYQDNFTYYGLDKICLNNLIQDNTMMKDYLTYKMMYEFGADAPLCSYVYVTV